MSHRDFVHKRAPHQAIAARFIPTYSYPGQTSDTAAPAGPATSSSAKTTDTINPLTPPAVTPKTSSTSTISSSTPSSTPTSTSTTSTSSSSSSSSSSSARSTPPPQIPVATPPPVSTKVAPGTLTFTLTTATTTPTPTSTPTSSSGPSTTAIVGGVAGALAGIAVLGFIIMWCMRRQRNRDNDDFDPSVFKRQSAILVDDPLEPPQTYNPRPPIMLERHNASPALAAQAGYGGQNFYGNYGGYNQQSPYPSPEMNSYAGSPPPQQYGTAAMGYGYNEPPQGLGRQPSNPAYLTRQPSSVAGYGTLSPPSDAHYVDLNRSSVTPFQASQYADISSQLGTPNPNALAVQPREPAPLSEEPLPSPFDDPAEVFPPPPVATAAASMNQSAAPAIQPRQNATQHTQRPTSAYTVYEEGDAYGGI